LKCIIVDDAPQARELLRMMLIDLAEDIEVAGEAENVDQALKLIHEVNPDVVFLDIEMPGKSGLQLLEGFVKEQVTFEVVFVTAYHQYAIQAFRLSAIDYLMKPLRKQELQEALVKIKEKLLIKESLERLKVLISNLAVKDNSTICIPLNYGYDYLPINDIEYIEADRSYSYIHLAGGLHKVITKPLAYFDDMLQPFDVFVKVHRSYLVSLKYVSSYVKKSEGGTIVFKSGKKAEVARNYRKLFLDKLALKS
jgi:two-component system LytT family response regulator